MLFWGAIRKTNFSGVPFFLFANLFMLLGAAFLTQISLAKNEIDNELLDQKSNYIFQVSNILEKENSYQADGFLKYKHNGDSKIESIGGKVYLNIEKSDLQISVGDQLALATKVSKIRAPKNPNTFDFKSYKASQGIAHSGYVSKEDVAMYKKASGFNLLRSSGQIQKKLAKIIDKHISGKNELGVAAALILGDKTFLEDETKRAFGTAGALHVLAVSGLHVGIIYMIIMFFLKRFTKRKQKWLRLSILLFSIWSFALITGASPSVIRAASIFSLVGIGNAIQRYPSIYNTLSFAAFAMLIINPLLIFNISFQLSFTAVASIVFFQPIIYRQWIIDNFIGDNIWKLISLGVAAQLGTIPLTLYYFHQFPVFFWISGIIVVPAATIILILGLLMLLMSFIFQPFTSLIAYLLEKIIWLVNASIFTLEKIPFNSISGIWIESYIVFILYLALLAFLFSWIYKHKIAFYLSLVILGIAFIPGWKSSWEAQHQKKLVIYHQPYSSLLDYWQGTNAYQFHSDNLDQKKIKYTADGARQANHISKIELFDQQAHSNELYSILEIDSKHICILKKMPTAKIFEKVKTDFLLLSNSDIDISVLNKYFNFKMIIADGTIKPWIASRWKKDIALKYPEIKYWNTAEEGAFIYNFEDDE